MTTRKTVWFDLLLGLILVVAVLLCFADRSPLPIFGIVLPLTFTLAAVFSQAVRRHWITRRLQGVLAGASLIAMLLTIASAFLVVCLPISRSSAIGIDKYQYFYLVDGGPMQPNPLSTGSRNIVGHFEFLWAGSPFQSFIIANRWMTPSGSWITKSMAPILPTVIIIVIPTALLWALRIKRFRSGFCRNCDYDLTGNTSGVCPECGGPIPKASIFNPAKQMDIANHVMREDHDVLRKLSE